jgi:hypothetical protein
MPSDLTTAYLPLVVGVTGHHDLHPPDQPLLEQQVRARLDVLRTQYPATPLLLLSALTEGAERLVARVALACDIPLLVPLPPPTADALQECTRPVAQTEFQTLLAQARHCFTLPPLPDNPATTDLRSYVAAYVVRHSHILLTLWDGISAAEASHTAQIVQFRLTGIPEPYVAPGPLLSPPDYGPVYHLVTPRRNRPPPVAPAFTWHTLYPVAWDNADQAATGYVHLFAHLDHYNRDLRRQTPPWWVTAQQHRGVPLPTAVVTTLPPDQQALLARYAIADALALHFQRWQRRIWYGLFGLLVVMAGLFESYDNLVEDSQLLGKLLVLSAHLISLGLAYGVYYWAKQRHYQSNYLDYRALAEGLRVQLFWRLAGLADEVGEQYLRRQQNELAWIRYAIRAWNIPLDRGGPAVVTSPAALPGCRLALRHWVNDQRDYFTRASQWDHHWLDRQQQRAHRLFLGGLAVTVMLWWLQLGLLLPTWAGANLLAFLIRPLVVPVTLLLVAAAALQGYAEKLAVAEQAKQYLLMGQLFRRASERLEALLERGDVASSQQLLRELGREALRENGDWVLLHRERPLEVPK